MLTDGVATCRLVRRTVCQETVYAGDCTICWVATGNRNKAIKMINSNGTNNRITGTIRYKDPHSCIIEDDFGGKYFAYRLNFDSLQSGPWEDVRPGMGVSFLPVGSDRAKDDPRAIEVRITERAVLDGI